MRNKRILGPPGIRLASVSSAISCHFPPICIFANSCRADAGRLRVLTDPENCSLPLSPSLASHDHPSVLPAIEGPCAGAPARRRILLQRFLDLHTSQRGGSSSGVFCTVGFLRSRVAAAGFGVAPPARFVRGHFSCSSGSRCSGDAGPGQVESGRHAEGANPGSSGSCSANPGNRGGDSRTAGCSRSSSYDSVHRGYRFDRMLDSAHPDPLAVAALDSMALCTLKTVELPAAVLQKLQLLLKHVGRKKDIEKTGRLLADKTTARTSVELPRVLPSQLLPEAQQIIADTAAREAVQEQEGQAEAPAAPYRQESTARRLYLKGRDTHLLRSLPDATETLLSALPPDGLEAQEALAAAEDARHPLYRHITTGHSPLTAVAWTAHRFAGVYASMLRILTEIRTRCPHFFPTRVLEMNAGFAAGLMAVDTVYGRELENDEAEAPRKQGKTPALPVSIRADGTPAVATEAAAADSRRMELLMAVEPSAHLASVGRYLTADLNPSVQWQLGLYDEGLRRRQTRQLDTSQAVDDRFDLVLLPHALLRSVDGQVSRHALIRTIWNRIKPQGILVLLERGTASGFRVLASVRELFICELGTEKFHFVAPCPHESVCPLALTGRDWCHFGQRVRRIPHHLYCKGSRAKCIEEEKYSFLVIRKGQGPRSRFRSLAAAEAAGASVEEMSSFWPRLVAPPIKGREHVLLDVCAAPHRFERIAVSKHMPHAAGYKAARHAAWGDLWRHPRRIIRPDARAYMQQEIREAAERRHQRKVDMNQRTEVGPEDERAELDDTLIRHFGA